MDVVVPIIAKDKITWKCFVVFTLLCLFSFKPAFASGADSIVITGQLVHNAKYAIVVLEKFGVGSFPVFKTTIEKESGRFRMALPGSIEPGIYRLRYSMTNEMEHVDVIINGEPEVNLTIDLFNNRVRSQFIGSSENIAWYQYQHQQEMYIEKIASLNELIQNYPGDKTAKIIKEAQKELDKEIFAANQLRRSYLQQHKGQISARYEAQKPLKFFETNEAYQLQAYNMWLGYWKDINVKDTSLLNTPLYTEHIINYMKYWLDPGMRFNEKEQTEGFIKSVDTVLKHFNTTPTMYRFALEYLTLGFKELGQEAVLQYIDEQYNSKKQCENVDRELEDRLAAYKDIAPGRPAPKVYYTNISGVEEEFLKNVETDTVIIVFWASWCPHCLEAMPVLDRAIANKMNVSVLAISLDTDGAAYVNEKSKLGRMQHYCDYQKWDSRPVKDYHVMATPTFFMIDKDRFIAGKYASVEALLNALK